MRKLLEIKCYEVFGGKIPYVILDNAYIVKKNYYFIDAFCISLAMEISLVEQVYGDGGFFFYRLCIHQVWSKASYPVLLGVVVVVEK